MLIIDRITASDRADALPLLAAQMVEHDLSYTAEEIDRAVQVLLGPQELGAILLAREDGVAVGVVLLAYVSAVDPPGRVAALEEIYVVPERRNAGIGRALIERAYALAQEEGCLEIDLVVIPERRRAEHLYQRSGFQRLERSLWSRALAPSESGRRPPYRPVASIDHISLGVNDLARSMRFYDAALAPLGLVAHPQKTGDVAYGPPGPAPSEGFAFYIGFEDPAARTTVSPSAGFHLALRAPSREAVREFHRAALEAGGIDRGPPGWRPQYHASYYGAFVIDPDGHHIEAVCHAPREASEG